MPHIKRQLPRFPMIIMPSDDPALGRQPRVITVRSEATNFAVPVADVRTRSRLQQGTERTNHALLTRSIENTERDIRLQQAPLRRRKTHIPCCPRRRASQGSIV